MNQVDHGKSVKVDAYGQFVVSAKKKPVKKLARKR